MSEHLILTSDGPVATLVIDRAAKKNAISYRMWAAIPGIAARVRADDDVRVLVITGSADLFSAGADISEFTTLRKDPAGARRYADAIEAATKALTSLAKPTIAAINGFCIGGGCELALACDLRVAATDARFGVTPSKLGIVFNLPSTKQLVDAVGPAWAKQILFTGDIIDADTALRIGLVNELHAEPAKRAAELATTMASRSQVTIRGAKDIVRRIVDGRYEEDEEVHFMYSASVNSPDYAEGVSAFLEKRAPRF
ncbi:enoyl-CoA hydratase/isomerase family protein [Actinokineospora cianjurensis]|uniref:Enoyl-CoA hydratase/carnithine racemase n=1 Tax=Actinokineospora cianjurensis TaxID=585224 RepID=A0A421B563_9PSEU|nr:enoyl-CoA hydratase-related protein [Actinokineospora cianjurensis]RLK59531.1 enoyl-CoA hydratase/carnithine racemase [Actinokineospora cianjurensis]